MNKKIGILVLFLAIFFILYTTGYAATLFQQVGISSSPNPVGSGARAIGMGGAFIAIADDATAASWNPAGLIQLEKPEVSLVGDYLSKKESFCSKIIPEISTTNEVYDLNFNYLSVSYPFKLNRNMVISLNYQRLYEFKQRFHYLYNYSSLGVTLFQDKQFKQNGYIGAIGLAGAIEISPTLSFGSVLNIWNEPPFWKNGWEETFTEHGVGSQGGNPVTIDTYCKDTYSDFHGYNLNLGFLWSMNEHLTLGGVLKTQCNAFLKHRFAFSQQSIFDPPVDTTVSSQYRSSEHISLHLPLSYGIGLAWRVSDILSFDFDLYKTHWDKYILSDSAGNKFSPVDGRPQGISSVENTIQARCGGEYLFIDPKRETIIPIRAGIFYDPEPSYKKVKDFYGITCGSGIAYKRYVFDIAYQLRWGNDVDTGNLVATSRSDTKQHLLLTSLIIHF